MGIARDNISLRDQETFVKLVSKGLVEIGAKIQPTNECMHRNTQFKLETIAGTLTITLYHSQTFLFTVYAIFEEVSRARDKFNCNPNSGKYNIHIAKGKGTTAKTASLEAIQHFECTL